MARFDAIAEDSVQPVPCVFEFSIRLPWNQVTCSPCTSTSFASSRLWPPFVSTAQPKAAWIRFAASTISAELRIVIPDSTSLSGMFGVITVASGSSFNLSVSTASSLISFAPLVAIITGSTTMFLAL